MVDPSRSSLATILVVDDNEPVLHLVVAALEHANFRVLSATSGKTAIQLSDETSESIDLLLSDIDMPMMSGLDLASLLQGVRPNLHVMLMSGGDNGEMMESHSGWAYIQKPFVPVRLVHEVTDLLSSAA